MEPASTWALPVGPLQAWLLAVALSESHLLPHVWRRCYKALLPVRPRACQPIYEMADCLSHLPDPGTFCHYHKSAIE